MVRNNLKGLAMSLSLVEGEAQLTHLVNRFADAVNRGDFEELEQCWAADGVWTVTGLYPEGTAREIGGKNMAQFLQGRRGNLLVMVQAIASIVATEVSDDKVVGRSTLIESGRRKDGAGIYILGRYYDEIVRVGDEWLFKARSFEALAFDWSPNELTVPA
jgi:ketosteroid isomerase-like protein